MSQHTPAKLFFQPEGAKPSVETATDKRPEALPPEEAWEASRYAWLIEKNLQKALGIMAACWQQQKPNRSRLIKNEQLAQLGELYGHGLMQARRYSDAETVFRQLENYLAAGYATLMRQDINLTAHYWQQAALKRPRHWGLYLLGFVTRQPYGVPPFLHIRNHLEADLMMLCDAGRYTLIDGVLNYLPFLSQINPEAYKLAGRALMNKGHTVQAKQLLELGQSTMPQDLEVYFNLAQCLVQCQNKPRAILMLKQALLMNANYQPAQKLLQELTLSA